ncbi:MAG: ABC transporter ATP-binding protein [Planctomycetota bacterium]|jgi:ABC-type multidrug transport system ATPase subunit
MIELNAVTKRFGKNTAVDDLSLTIDAGQSVALWGSNGAGKTTLIRCILGILRHRGEVRINEVSLARNAKQARHLIGYVPQELAFHDDTRLSALMLFFASLRVVHPSRCAELLERVGLAGHERKRVRDLSGGMKQRLALAVALLTNPPIIILDEPTSNLDARGRGEVMETLTALKREDKTIIFASHKPDEVAALADRVIVMEHGRVIGDTTPSKLWPDSSPVITLRLHLNNASEQRAADLLREHGHAVNLNGHGLCVAVPNASKASPIRALLRAQIDVRDFEIVQDLGLQKEGTP